MSNPGNRIIFPLDVSSEREAWEWSLKLQDKVGIMKVGLEVFTQFGPLALHGPHQTGADVFLDLKLHDIPNTVGKAAEAAARHHPKFLSVHAAGGVEMMQAAVQGAGNTTKVLAITVLTSMTGTNVEKVFNQRSEDVGDIVKKLADLAYEGGARGFVCSPLEVKILREHLGPDVTLVVPGVRPLGADTHDQKRVATPDVAIRDGADYLVIGRPIRNAPDLDSALARIYEDIQKGSS